MKSKYIVELTKPKGVSHADMVEYIETEVQSAIGGIDPIEPITKLDRNSVSVKEYRCKKIRTYEKELRELLSIILPEGKHHIEKHGLEDGKHKLYDYLDCYMNEYGE